MYNREQECYASVPGRLLDAMDAHAKTGRPTGQFVQAVLENDLFKAVCYADPETMAVLKKIVTYANCQLPPGCRGTPEKVRQWRKEMKGGS